MDFDELDEQEDELEQKEALARPPTFWTPWEPMAEDAWKHFPKSGPGQKPANMGDFKKVVNDIDPGEFWGLPFPLTPAQLNSSEFGPGWLTKAMHAAGTLPKDNEIVKFTQFDVKGEDVDKGASTEGENADWGGAGTKVLLSVEYKNGPGELSEHMFVKQPHVFRPENERYKISAAMLPFAVGGFSEIVFYNVFAGRLPAKTPKGYFADISRRTTNYILIIERIPYSPKGTTDCGPGVVLPAPAKYRDWELQHVPDLYYAHARTMAQFFAWSRLTRAKTSQLDKLFSDDVSRTFREGLFRIVGPKTWEARDADFAQLISDPEIGPALASLGFPPANALGFLQLEEDFVFKKAKNIFPRNLVSEEFSEKFNKEAKEMANYLGEMRLYSSMMPEYLALCHPNAQLDNAYYWRDGNGEMQCGLLDFDGVIFNSMPDCLGNAWMGAEPDMMDEYEERLVKFFLAEYFRESGERLDFDNFYMCMKLAQACVMYGCFANIGTLLRVFPVKDWPKVKNRRDPKVDQNFLVRCYMVQVEMFRAMWVKRSPYPYFQRWLRRTRLRLSG